MNQMLCTEAEDRIVDRLHGRLDPLSSGRLDGHLEGCSTCREQERLVGWLREAAASPPTGLSPRLRTAARDAFTESHLRPHRQSLLARVGPMRTLGLATAATLVMGFGALFVARAREARTEAVLDMLADVGSVWVGAEGIIAGAPVMDDLSHLTDDQLLAMLEVLNP